jgi:hypothetical protein
MDEIDFEFSSEDGNLLTMVKYTDNQRSKEG